MSFSKESRDIGAVIDKYFRGLFEGDTAKLAEVFAEDSILYGDIDGEPFLKKRQEFLDLVDGRPSLESQGDTFRMKVLSLEVLGPVAFARLSAPMMDKSYVDLISLYRFEDGWKIVNKLFVNGAGG